MDLHCLIEITTEPVVLVEAYIFVSSDRNLDPSTVADILIYTWSFLFAFLVGKEETERGYDIRIASHFVRFNKVGHYAYTVHVY